MINILKTTKDDIKEAISNQENGYIDGGMVTYADSIRNIKHINYISDYTVPVGLKFTGSWGYSFNQFDFSNITDMSYMFSGTGRRMGYYDGTLDIRYADSIELNNTIVNGKNCEGMFSTSYYRYLVIPSLPNADNCSNMFSSCEAYTITLNSLPSISSGKNMFYTCPNVTTIEINAMSSDINNTSYMFYGCPNLSLINITTDTGDDIIYPSNVVSMFRGCSKLSGFPFGIAVDNLSTLNMMYAGCESITSANIVGDGSKITDVSGMFGKCYKLRTFNGITNFGATSDLMNAFDFSSCDNLTSGSAKNIIAKLYDRASAGYKIMGIIFSTFTDISDEDIAIATQKGWTILIN